MVCLRQLRPVPMLLLALVTTASAEEVETPPPRTLIVGTKVAPPFAIKSPTGSWSGIGIDLWRDIAAELDLHYDFRETNLEGLIRGVADGTLDAAVAAITVTPEREKLVDFSHPFHSSGLGIAVPLHKARWLRALREFFSWTFLKIVLGLFLVLGAAGMLVWFFERRHNPQQFGSKFAKGFGDGLWWSAVTMTTVGYGDKTPRTAAGRTVAVILMFVGIVLVSGFTAALASMLTTAGLESQVRGPQDLPHVRVVTVEGTTSEAYLRTQQISFRSFGSAEAALKAVALREADAAVYDRPILRYLVNQRYVNRLQVLPQRFDRQYYAIALPTGSPMREAINRVLLEKISDPAWEHTLFRYMGS
jgi:polar amino acid transport system substrate-binding protein